MPRRKSSEDSKPKSKLKTLLSEEQQIKLADRLLGGMIYSDAIPYIEKEFHVKVSERALSEFWQSDCAPLVLARKRKAVMVAQALGQVSKEDCKQVQNAVIATLQQRALELLIQPHSDPEEIFFVISQALKARDQDLKAEQLTLQKDKFEFDAATACLKHMATLKTVVSNTALDQGAKIQEIRKLLFGKLPK